MKKSLERKIITVLVQVIHWAMFGVSAIFSVRLFTLLGSTAMDSWLYGGLAVAFEGAKIMLWEIGNRMQKAIALAFVCVSLLASTGVAVSISAKTANMGTDEGTLLRYEGQIKEYDTLIAGYTDSNRALDDQIVKLPSGYTRSAERLTALKVQNAELQAEAMTKRDNVVREMQEYRDSRAQHTEATMFTLLAKLFRVSESAFMFVFMLVVSVLLEIGALTTTHREEVVPEEARPVPTLSNLATCKCGSRQVSLDRLANGKYVVRCRACGSNTSITDSEEQAREEWKEKIK